MSREDRKQVEAKSYVYSGLQRVRGTRYKELGFGAVTVCFEIKGSR